MIPARTFLTSISAIKLHRVQCIGVIAGLFLIFTVAGCQVPSAPPHAAQQGTPSNQSDEGWLWRQLRGEDKQKNPAPAAQPQLPPQQQSQPQTPPQPQTQNPPQSPASSPVVPAVGSYSPSSKARVIIPAVAVEPIEPAKPNEISMSRIGPAQPVVTPPPVLPPDPPPSIVSSNSA